MTSLPRQNMTHHNPARPSASPFSDQAKSPTPKLSAKAAFATGARRSMRVIGTLHLPDHLRPRR